MNIGLSLAFSTSKIFACFACKNNKFDGYTCNQHKLLSLNIEYIACITFLPKRFIRCCKLSLFNINMFIKGFIIFYGFIPYNISFIYPRLEPRRKYHHFGYYIAESPKTNSTVTYPCCKECVP